jgi:tetratricopeptide (TPR) repeat protein
MSDPSRRPKPRTDRKPPTGGPSDRKPTDRKPTERKPYDRKPTDGKPDEGAPYDRKPRDGAAGDRKPYDRKPYDRKPRDGAAGDRKPYDRKPYDGKPRDGAATDRKPYDRKPREGSAADRKPGDRKPFDRKPSDRKPFDRAAAGAERRPPRDDDRPRHDDPEIPEDVTANLLDKVARAELKTLSKDNADWVARHLVMAGRLIESDPELAHKHSQAAGRRAGRVAVVRESVGITAYALGEFELALRELRTYRRISGRDDQLPLMVDSERGIGRPEKALELGRSVVRASLDVPVQVALAIAMSGARLDLGQPEAALTELQIPQLDPERAYVWSPALFDAYATVLEDLGRDEEAEQWWQRSDRATIALENAAIPEGEDTVEIIDEDWDPDAPH